MIEGNSDYDSLIGKKIVKTIDVKSPYDEVTLFELDDGTIMYEADGEYGGNNTRLYSSFEEFKNAYGRYKNG